MQERPAFVASKVNNGVRRSSTTMGMRVRIHGGAERIGGSCVEVEAEGVSVLLDFGLPLGPAVRTQLALPDVKGLTGEPDSLAGILVTHGHPDHYGLLGRIGAGIPVYMGEAAERVLREAHFFGAASQIPELAGHLADRYRQQVGPFLVTSYLVDHSAFDAFALEVEHIASGRRLFYSGDFRGHGRKGWVFDVLLLRPPPHVNAMLLEGTRLSRPEGTDASITERDVEHELIALFSETEGLALACYSAQNIDRLVSLFRAALQCDRDLVIDLYTAAVAAATGKLEAVPQADWDRVRVYVPHSQRRRVIANGEFSRIERIRAARIYPEEMVATPEQFVLSFRPSMIDELAIDYRGASAVWSMWPGYLKEPRMDAFHEFLERNRIPLSVAHSSGHASAADLRRLAEAIDPDRVIPIHTDAPDRYEDIFGRVERHRDGEWWDV